jgi:NADH-quinone oxidoreductase subunit C
MARKDELLQKLQATFPAEAIGTDESRRSGTAFTVRVPARRLRDAAGICEAMGFYLESITGLDFQDVTELVYHLNCYEPKSRLALRVLCEDAATPPTVSDIFPSALWLEREVHEFFGVAFTNHPDLRPLLLPEDASYHPLQKTFGKVHAHCERKEIYG